MTYETTVEGTRLHNVAFYVAFDGVAARFSTHDPDSFANWSPSETFYPVLVRDSISGGGQRLDRKRGIVMPSGFAFTIASTSDTRAVFRRKGGTESRTLDSRSATNTTIRFVDTNPFDVSGGAVTVHIGREAISLTSFGGAGTYTSSTRGHLNTVADAFLGGAIGSTVPRHWRGRRVHLYAVNVDDGTERELRTGILADFPRQEDGLFVLSATDLTTALNRPILTGWNEQPITDPDYPQAVDYAHPASGYTLEGVRFKVEDPRQIKPGSPGFLMFKVGEGSALVAFRSPQSSLDASGLFDVVWNKVAGRGPGNDRVKSEVIEAADISVRQAHLLTDRLGIAALQMIQSRYGDNGNGTYDVIPGRPVNFDTTQTDLAPKRVGAGIPSAWVDEASFEAIRGGRVEIIVDEEMSLFDWLSSEVLWRAGGFIYVNGSGQLAWKNYTPLTVRGSLDALTKADVLQASVVAVDSEAEQIGRVLFSCNYIPGEGFTETVSVHFEEVVGLYDIDPEATVEVKAKSIWVGNVDPAALIQQVTGSLQIRAQMERYRSFALESRRSIKLLLPWDRHVDYVVGHRFSYTDDRIVDADGTLGITAQPFEVVGARMDYGEGVVEIEAEQLPTGVRVGFSAVVDSWDGGTLTLTLKTSGVHGNGTIFDSNPGQDVGTEWTVRIFDASAAGGAFSASEAETVASVTASTIVLNAAPSAFTPADGDLVVLEDMAETSTGTNAAGADVWDYAFGADANDQIGAGAFQRDANEWQ